MDIIIKNIIEVQRKKMTDNKFNQWLLEFLITDTNNTSYDFVRLEILKYVSEKEYV